jgi:DNA ligase (NAD+)
MEGFYMENKIKVWLDKLDEYDNAYYNRQPVIDNASYDSFKDFVHRHLPADHPRLEKIGHSVCSPWPKKKHAILMGSQNKVSSEKEIINWVKKITDDLNLKKPEWILQNKIDGFSLETCYSDGKIYSSLTRGNGFIGDDILENAKMFRFLPSYIPINSDVICRGEAVISKADFIKIQAECGDQYKNARSAASGISRRLDGKYNKYIRYITYDINANVAKEIEKINILKKLGFLTVDTIVCHTIDEIIKYYHLVRNKKRKECSYDIDGLVLKLNDISLQEELGIKKNKPEGQIALKFESDSAATEVIDIIPQIGRTGKITPVGKLDDVELMGSTIKRATLHNYKYVLDMGIGPGAEVIIEKKGDIIPQVTKVIIEGDKFSKPDTCPSCGGFIKDDGVNLWCLNKVCKEKNINQIAYWIKVIGMKHFSLKFIERLWNLNKIRIVSDLYKLEVDDFIAVEGIGGKTIQLFFRSIEETSEMYLDKFLTALGIPSFSSSKAKILVNKFETWENILKLKVSDLEEIEGFAKVSSETVIKGITEVRDLAQDLLNVIKIKEKKRGSLTGLSFCVTGSLLTMKRKDFQGIVEENGGIAKNSVSGDLDYLVSNENSSSNKMKKALKYGIKIINEEAFLELIGKKLEVEKKDKEEQETFVLVSESLF